MNNFKKLFKKVTARQFEEGAIWYEQAHKDAQEISRYTGASIYQVAGVISALSPLKAWDVNLRIANDFIHTYQETGRMLPCHFGANVIKAFDIMSSDGEKHTVESFFTGGSKTHSFYLNLIGDLSVITWDSHMINLANTGKRKAIDGTKSLSFTKATKEQATKNVHKLCKEYDLQPAQIQAILWVAYRELEISDKEI